MRHGGMPFVTAAVLCCTACLGEQGKLEVRSTSTGLKAGQEPVPFRIAEARGHLVLGNVALALEGFRKAAREDPASVDALTGIAYCYDQMGRYDLSRRHYEMALALAPRDTALLAAFAGSLDRQGLTAEAASVRREMAALAVPSVPVVATSSPTPELPAVARIASTPASPQATAPVGPSVTIALPPPRPVGTKPVAPAHPQAQAVALAAIGRSVTIALPPARPAPVADQPVAPVTVVTRSPRLERLSLTEVALVTGSGLRWVRPVAQPVRTAARTAPSKAFEVRVLNAARVDRLASRTRAFLGRFGWRDIAVGDAVAVRSRSLIVYPKGAQQAASRLSARLGFAMAPRNDVRQLTILLGRDAADHPGLRPKA
jgi:hypothetical protein